MRKRSLVLAVVLSASASARAEEQTLFRLGRSKNANVVEYAARVGPDGRLDSRDPIEAHWLLNAEDGRREGLNFFERALGFGVRALLSHDGQVCDASLVSLPARHFRVRASNGRYVAEMPIGGAPSQLVSVFVTAQEGSSWPKVLSVELRGRRLDDGAATYERVVP